ncbi:MAG: MBL fold metallo-hydrolase [Gemmobacter sp.]|uniref:MBL fold metallo-hydrolase n=1 Tax=Gemmobacter sp. TaxID=1898957 RepID=UPI00391874F4
MDSGAAQIRFPHAEPPAPGAATEVAEGVLWMRLPLPMALDHVNVYALDDGDGWTLVDTGFDTRKTRALWDALLAGPLAFRPVRRVLATHHHPDHIGLAGWFQDQGAELLTSRTAWLYARMLALDVQEKPTAEQLAFWRAAGMAPEIYARRSAERPYNAADVVAPMPLGFTRLVEGQRLRAGGRDWVVRMGDGHAPEHVTLWDSAGELVIGGDQLLPGISANIGVYATEPEADPLAEWMAACARMAPFATPAQLVLPGHKLPFHGLPLRLRQMVDNHHGALARLKAHLAQPRTAAECFVPLFGRELTGDTYGLALVESVAHLNHLHAAGEVTRYRGPGGAWLWQALPAQQGS